MELLKYIVLAIVQGVAEVLPISSSGHLVLAESLLGIESNDMSLEVFLHVASLIATIVFLRKRLWQLIKGFFLFIFKKETREKYRYDFIFCWLIVLATVPVVIVTLLVGKYVEAINQIVWLVGIFLVINGISLLIFSKIKVNRTKDELNYKDALVIGAFQCFGILSGISRSGSCIYGASVRKIDNTRAADFAFLLLIPAILGALVLNINDMSNIIVGSNWWIYLVCFVITGVITYFSFKLLLAVIRKHKLSYFGYYCISIGLFAFVYGVMKK